MKKPINLSDWFKITFRNMQKDVDELQNALNEVEKEYPKLFLAYNLLSIYAKYLERLNKFMARNGLMYKPIPDGDHGSNITFPPDIERDFFKELDEFMAKQVQYGAELDAANRQLCRTCINIRSDYNNAARCVKKYLTHLPATEEEWDEYHQCLSNLQRFASEMESYGCRF